MYLRCLGSVYTSYVRDILGQTALNGQMAAGRYVYEYIKYVCMYDVSVVCIPGIVYLVMRVYMYICTCDVSVVCISGNVYVGMCVYIYVCICDVSVECTWYLSEVLAQTPLNGLIEAERYIYACMYAYVVCMVYVVCM